ncbi:nitronate monooxygenase [Bdellovibrio sp. 22V]|uniref:NAD(P)H-dependent flavin oxidoreductase n=1 Tax=Bdellovibrio TaxID=958 RepID=UPI0025426D6F|nr:nitronate monooxygenase [Bdellovibrio sp. 22V]WII73388.1 nitronate monooxygenase [Bdellovibrio sp. 22V]
MAWNQTSLTKTLGLRYPIIQGPFGGGLSSVSLLAKVSNLGGLGSYGAHYMTAEQIQELCREVRSTTKNPYAINLWVSDHDEGVDKFTKEKFEAHLKRMLPFYKELSVPVPEMPSSYGQKFVDQIDVLIKEKPPVISFVYGVPDSAILQECRKQGIKTIGTATTVEEGLLLEKAGIDVVVASGFEAGGHRGSFVQSAEKSLTGTFSLVPQMAENLKIPFAAAGGVANGKGIAAALTLGAQGVQIGTAFLACEESAAAKFHREKLLSKGAAGRTVLTRIFTGRLARGIENRLVQDLDTIKDDLPPYPIQSWFTGQFKKAAIDQGRSDMMSLWASQSYPLLKHKTVDALFRSLIEETSAYQGAAE